MGLAIEYKDMCKIKQLGKEKTIKEDIKLNEELIDECIKSCDALIDSVEKFKAHIEKYKK